jgi:ATPase, YjeE family
MPTELYTTESAAETEALGRGLARRIMTEHRLDRECVFIALYGGLGAGKTAFVRGLASALAPSSTVSSPTYAIVNEYRNPPITLAHFDLYRIESEDDLLSCGFDDYFRPGTVIAAEWCENIPYALPQNYYKVKLAVIGEGTRGVTIEYISGAL